METRKKIKNDWELEVEQTNKKRREEKEGINMKIGELQRKIDYLKEFKTREAEYLSVLANLKEKEEQNRSQQKREIEKIVAEHEGLRK